MLAIYGIFILTLTHALAAVPPVYLGEHGQVWTRDQIILQSIPAKCDYHCTTMDMPICAGNGQCLQLFQSQCAMEAYNCKHPLKPFQMIKDALCEQSWAPMCKSNEIEI